MGQKQDKASSTDGGSPSTCTGTSGLDGQDQTHQGEQDAHEETQSEYSTEWDTSDSEDVSPTPDTAGSEHVCWADPMTEPVGELAVRPNLNAGDNPSPESGVGEGGGGGEGGGEGGLDRGGESKAVPLSTPKPDTCPRHIEGTAHSTQSKARVEFATETSPGQAEGTRTSPRADSSTASGQGRSGVVMSRLIDPEGMAHRIATQSEDAMDSTKQTHPANTAEDDTVLETSTSSVQSESGSLNRNKNKQEHTTASPRGKTTGSNLPREKEVRKMGAGRVADVPKTGVDDTDQQGVTRRKSTASPQRSQSSSASREPADNRQSGTSAGASHRVRTDNRPLSSPPPVDNIDQTGNLLPKSLPPSQGKTTVCLHTRDQNQPPSALQDSSLDISGSTECKNADNPSGVKQDSLPGNTQALSTVSDPDRDLKLGCDTTQARRAERGSGAQGSLRTSQSDGTSKTLPGMEQRDVHSNSSQGKGETTALPHQTNQSKHMDATGVRSHLPNAGSLSEDPHHTTAEADGDHGSDNSQDTLHQKNVNRPNLKIEEDLESEASGTFQPDRGQAGSSNPVKMVGACTDREQGKKDQSLPVQKPVDTAQLLTDMITLVDTQMGEKEVSSALSMCATKGRSPVHGVAAVIPRPKVQQAPAGASNELGHTAGSSVLREGGMARGHSDGMNTDSPPPANHTPSRTHTNGSSPVGELKATRPSPLCSSCPNEGSWSEDNDNVISQCVPFESEDFERLQLTAARHKEREPLYLTAMVTAPPQILCLPESKAMMNEAHLFSVNNTPPQHEHHISPRAEEETSLERRAKAKGPPPPVPKKPKNPFNKATATRTPISPQASEEKCRYIDHLLHDIKQARRDSFETFSEDCTSPTDPVHPAPSLFLGNPTEQFVPPYMLMTEEYDPRDDEMMARSNNNSMYYIRPDFEVMANMAGLCNQEGTRNLDMEWSDPRDHVLEQSAKLKGPPPPVPRKPKNPFAHSSSPPTSSFEVEDLEVAEYPVRDDEYPPNMHMSSEMYELKHESRGNREREREPEKRHRTRGRAKSDFEMESDLRERRHRVQEREKTDYDTIQGEMKEMIPGISESSDRKHKVHERDTLDFDKQTELSEMRCGARERIHSDLDIQAERREVAPKPRTHQPIERARSHTLPTDTRAVEDFNDVARYKPVHELIKETNLKQDNVRHQRSLSQREEPKPEVSLERGSSLKVSQMKKAFDVTKKSTEPRVERSSPKKGKASFL